MPAPLPFPPRDEKGREVIASSLSSPRAFSVECPSSSHRLRKKELTTLLDFQPMILVFFLGEVLERDPFSQAPSTSPRHRYGARALFCWWPAPRPERGETFLDIDNKIPAISDPRKKRRNPQRTHGMERERSLPCFTRFSGRRETPLT